MDGIEPLKPKNVLYAEWALWLWTVGTCLFGMYTTWKSIPEIEQTMQDQLQGMIQIAPQTLLYATIIGYSGLGLASAWIVIKIGEGKNWARSSLLWGVILEVGGEAFSSSHDLQSVIADIPDYGLQICALYLVYTKPGKNWFRDRPLSKTGLKAR